MLPLGMTAAFELIDQANFKLTFLNLPTKSLNLQNEPPNMALTGKYLVTVIMASLIPRTSSVCFIPFCHWPLLH
jgi:hypothetical protein